jgi:hypothetical protein
MHQEAERPEPKCFLWMTGINRSKDERRFWMTDNGERMGNMTLKLTLEELRLLAGLAADQLFRKQFIDPKMPGYRARPEEMKLGKTLVARLQTMVDECCPTMAEANPKTSSTIALTPSRGRPANRKQTGESAVRRHQMPVAGA